VYGEDDAVCVVVAGLEVIDHEVILEPPFSPVNVNVASVFPADALTLGVCGTVVAVIALDAADAADVP
jgi:hypothetical protein